MNGGGVRDRLARMAGLAGWLAAYAAGFAALHWMARPWGGSGYFSLWYPAAGLRFAMLWHKGVRVAPALIVTELATDWLTGAVPVTGPDVLHDALGVMRPGVAMAAAIGGVEALCRRGERKLLLPPMPLGLAALAAPLLSGLLLVPLEAALPRTTTASGVAAGMVISHLLSLTGMVVGDLLGILVLAPPLLWLAQALEGRALPAPVFPALRSVLLDALVMAACLAVTLVLWNGGLGVQATPAMLGGAWVGLRHGRGFAWLAILADLLLFLPYSAVELDGGPRLELHLGLAGVVIVTWLAGCFADAQAAARAALEKRNRLLFQAERLKTLRAMSVAVIHEISQPLSTLAIEAAHLSREAEAQGLGIAASAALIDRKAQALSELVRRLRRFGGRDADEPSVLPVAMLVAMAGQMIAQEAAARGATITQSSVGADLMVHGQEIELAQALLNLLRNALNAAGTGRVAITVERRRAQVVIAVLNPVAPAQRSGAAAPGDRTAGDPGMGVGLMIVRSIVEAHGGALEFERGADRVRAAIVLPLVEGGA
ncbi:ATP-binding protein [Novosphingobium sp. 1949]|uniref:histidine kinase n=1 Tax=Novosphingobium organovorum TaxID=2930092 RepID=A0ABT0BCQ3_9SPHN|nr:ATP-binding protein [Novosphingobium organovorum]MCJ2182566.1 ATP-binding protein [Novosphingobium organovorum]